MLSEERGDHNFYPHVLLLTVCAFLVLRNLPWERLQSCRLAYRAVIAVSGASFTIYLLHALFLEAQTYHFSPIKFRFPVTPWIGIPAITVLVIAECLLFTILIKWAFCGRLRAVGRIIAP